MQEHDLTFVRAEMAVAQKAPRNEVGPLAWVQKNLFASVPDAILTLIGLIVVALVLPPMIRWADGHRPQLLFDLGAGRHPA
jgi:general L-amino acid transport system permease protein